MSFDLLAGETRTDPYPVYRQLREDSPLAREEQFDLWVLSRYDDVLASIHDHETFSSVGGVGLIDTRPDPLPMMILMDPPDHDDLRRVVSRLFTRRAIGLLEDQVRRTASAVVESLPAAGQVDLVEHFTVPMPTNVIADLLGVARSDRSDFKRWSDAMVQNNPIDAASRATTESAAAELFMYFDGVIARRRSELGDDLISHLMNAQVGERGLTHQELLSFCLLLLVAGNETTTNLLGNAVVALDSRPALRARLLSEPDMLGAAVEEFLRFDSPVQALVRRATRPVEIHGRVLPAESRFLLLLGAANRDERAIDAPDEIVLERAGGRGIPFGHGAHYCLGAWLARLESRVALAARLARFPGLRIAADPEWRNAGVIRGPGRLVVDLG